MSNPFKPGGVGEYELEGIITTVHTKKCIHCQTVVEFPRWRDVQKHMDFCRSCYGFICLPCADKPCVHHMRLIEEAERRHYRRQQLAKALGI